MELVKNVQPNRNSIQGNQKIKIHERLHQVMLGVDSIPKNGFNEHSNYAYIKAVDVIKGVKGLLINNRIGLTIDEMEVIREEKQGVKSTNFHTQIKCAATFYCVEDPSDKEVTTYYSASSDRLDKDIFKAKTNGLKYMFIQKFLIESDDALIDTEKTNPEEKREFVNNYKKNNYPNNDKQNNTYKNNYKQNNNSNDKQNNNYKNNYGQNKSQSYGQNQGQRNNGGTSTPKQIEYINYIQGELNLAPHLYSQNEILNMKRESASEAIEYLLKQSRIMGIKV